MARTYFAEINGGSEQLWTTDGTVAGTRMLRAFSSSAITQLTVIGAHVYFGANDGTSGQELWVSDGTTSGTVLVDDLNAGSADSAPGGFVNLGGTLYFSASDGVDGRELWATDGTAAHTVMIKDINPGGGGSNPNFLTNVNGTLFFEADDGTHGIELWKSDGTTAGTMMIKDINPAGNSTPGGFVNVNGTVFFEANDGVNGLELWKTDGTTAGTVMVKDINPGSGWGFPGWLTNLNGTLLFEANDGVHGSELWRSDGTAPGTVMIKDISPVGGSVPSDLTDVNGTVFFQASDGAHGQELWKTDGTATGTVMVKDIDPGTGNGGPLWLTNVRGTLFFAANDGVHGQQLWKSDGTAAGTVMVGGPPSAQPIMLTNVNGVLEFYGFDGTTEGLFRSDGTAAGTIELATHVDIFTPIGFAPPPRLHWFNGDGLINIVWRSNDGGPIDWSMEGGVVSSTASFTSAGVAVVPDKSWSIAGITDFNGDGAADMLWRNTDGSLADWTMSGSVINSSSSLTMGGKIVQPDASWSIAGVGDFDGDTRSDIVWRNPDGTLALWCMDGSNILSSGSVTSGGVVMKPDASWIIAGIGDFDGDNRRDLLWRNTSGEVAVWLMNGSGVSGGGDASLKGVAVKPDASWSVAGVGDFDGDGNSDILWRNSNGSLVEWLMNGSTITSSGNITMKGTVVAPDASWHVVEVGDFDGDGNSDVLWRNDSGAMAEWLMNGTTIMQSVTPTSNGQAINPGAGWSTQGRPTDFG